MKRKLEEDLQDDRKVSPSISSEDGHQDLEREVRTQVEILESSFSSSESDRASSKRAIHVLSEFAKNGNRFAFHFILDQNFRCSCREFSCFFFNRFGSGIRF